MPIIAAAVLSHEGIVRRWCALPLRLLGVLSGDMVLYWVGRYWGEQVLNWRVVRLVLSPARDRRTSSLRHSEKPPVNRPTARTLRVPPRADMRQPTAKSTPQQASE